MTELNDATELPSPVRELIDVVNDHDEKGFLDAFTVNGYVDDWGRVFTGREAIKGWSDEEFIGAQGVLTPSTLTQEGDTVTVVGAWASTHANGLSRFTFHIAGDKVASMTIREG